MSDDEQFMRLALEEAQKAAKLGEVPIGAVAVRDSIVIARAHNRVECKKTVTAHAEIELLHAVEQSLGDWRMEEITFYVTKEPCAMCAGALVNARLKRLVFGLPDSRCGACGSSELNVCVFSGMLWKIEVTSGVLAEECRELVSQFFSEVRKRKKGV